MRKELPISLRPCFTRGCEYTVCIWANETLCFRCLQKAIGKEEMIRRYNATHDVPWDVVYPEQL